MDPDFDIAVGEYVFSEACELLELTCYSIWANLLYILKWYYGIMLRRNTWPSQMDIMWKKLYVLQKNVGCLFCIIIASIVLSLSLQMILYSIWWCRSFCFPVAFFCTFSSVLFGFHSSRRTRSHVVFTCLHVCECVCRFGFYKTLSVC